MLVAVTGGTGYVGAHTVRGLLAAGHTVRLLVAPGCENEPVIPRLAELGELDIVHGDIRSADTVTALLDGAEAVLHAAAVVGTDARREQLMWEINAHAAEAILTRAAAAGLDPIIAVSSYSAMFPPPDGVIGPDTPTVAGRSPYARTKGYADTVARRLQADGAPVVISYPSSVVGPAFHTAPGVTETGWAMITRHKVAPKVRGGMMMIDVRDVAAVHAAAMAPGRGPHRYVCGGKMVTFNEMVDAVETGLGQPIRRLPISPGLFRAAGRLADLAGRFVPLGAEFSYEAAWLLTSATPTDDSATLSDLGLSWRSPTEAIIASFG